MPPLTPYKGAPSREWYEAEQQLKAQGKAPTTSAIRKIMGGIGLEKTLPPEAVTKDKIDMTAGIPPAITPNLPEEQVDDLTAMRILMRNISQGAYATGVGRGLETVTKGLEEQGLGMEGMSGDITSRIISFVESRARGGVEQQFQTMSDVMEGIEKKQTEAKQSALTNLGLVLETPGAILNLDETALTNIANTTGISIDNLQAIQTAEQTNEDLRLAQEKLPERTQVVEVAGKKQLIDLTTGNVIKDLGLAELPEGPTVPVDQITSSDQLSPLAKSIFDGTIGLKDVTPTQRAKIAPELNAIGWTNNLKAEDKSTMQFIKTQVSDVNNPSSVLAKWRAVSNKFKGPVQGRLTERKIIGLDNSAVQAFLTSLGFVSQQLASLVEKGRLTDSDRVYYMGLMPTLLQENDDAAKAKADDMVRLLEEKLNNQTKEFSSGVVEPTKADSDYAKEVLKTLEEQE